MCLGIPGIIVEITSEPENLAVVDVAGVRRTVNISCILDEQHPPEACLGEWVLVHTLRGPVGWVHAGLLKAR